MAKYIEADRLKAEIEKHIKEVKDAEKRFTPNMGFFDAKLSGIYDVIALIDSLQQEQPSLSSNLNEAAEEYLEQYNESEFGNGGDDWDDDIRITFKAGAEWMARQMKQEKPEVDLKKEIRSMWKKCEPTDEGMGVESTYMHIEAFDIIARYFYELGKNSK